MTRIRTTNNRRRKRELWAAGLLVWRPRYRGTWGESGADPLTDIQRMSDELFGNIFPNINMETEFIDFDTIRG